MLTPQPYWAANTINAPGSNFVKHCRPGERRVFRRPAAVSRSEWKRFLSSAAHCCRPNSGLIHFLLRAGPGWPSLSCCTRAHKEGNNKKIDIEKEWSSSKWRLCADTCWCRPTFPLVVPVRCIVYCGSLSGSRTYRANVSISSNGRFKIIRWQLNSCPNGRGWGERRSQHRTLTAGNRP